MRWIINVREENWGVCKESGLHSFGDKAIPLARTIRPGDSFIVWRPGKGFVASGEFTSICVEGAINSPWPNYRDCKSVIGISVREEFDPIRDRWSHKGDRSFKFAISKAGLQTGLQPM